MNEDGAVRVALVNDYEVVVAGLNRMLAPYDDRVEIVEIVTGQPPESDVDIALYDTFAQVGGGSIDCSSIMSDCSAKRVVIYSWNTSPEAVAEALSVGASGYLPKAMPAEELVSALEKIYAGEQIVAVTDDRPEDLEDDGAGDWPGHREGLSEREAEVIALIAQGLSNEQVASRAFLSINTVKSYIRSGYRKMGVESRSQAVLWAIDHGFRPDRMREHPQDDPV